MNKPKLQQLWTGKDLGQEHSTSPRRACLGSMQLDWVFLWSIRQSAFMLFPVTRAPIPMSTCTSWSTVKWTMTMKQRCRSILRTKRRMKRTVMTTVSKSSRKSALCPAIRPHWSPCSPPCVSARLCTQTQRMTTPMMTLRDRSTMWRKQSKSKARVMFPHSSPTRRGSPSSRPRARPLWADWRGCWPSLPHSSTTWLASGPRNSPASLRVRPEDRDCITGNHFYFGSVIKNKKKKTLY
ncbi:hypothetical protein ACEWY4_008628 [Coilia grayii]|uniref:Uncharacterized protein n=1 Tax=Coilia grayii TaxID=363190 RepID=A0ABD1KBE8_9TELE